MHRYKTFTKFGFASSSVDDRIKNAKKEATYLFADVQKVATYSCYNRNADKLESLLHRFFAEACLDIDLNLDNRQRLNPREWFVVPFDGIDIGGKTNGDFIKETRESIKYLESRREEIVRLTEKAGVEFGKSEREFKTRIGEEEKRLQEQIDSIPEQFERELFELEEKYRSSRARIKREIEQLRIEETGLPDEYAKLRGEIEKRYSRSKEQISREFEVENVEGSGWSSQEYKQLHEFKKSVMVYNSALKKNDRIEQDIREKNN